MTPIIWILIFYLSGIILSSFWSISIFTFGALFLLYLFLFFYLKLTKKKKYYFLAYSLFFLIGIGYANYLYQSHHVYSSQKTISFQGIIVSEIETKANRKQFKFRLHTINHTNYKKTVLAYVDNDSELIPGMHIEGYGFFSQNSSHYFLGKNLWGSLQIKFIESLKTEKNYFFYVHKIRKWIHATIVKGIPDDSKYIISALILGQRDKLSKQIQQYFSNSGTIHILAVSGLHLGLIAYFVFFMFGFFVRTRKEKLLGVAVFVVLYVLLIGERASILRAGLMTELGILMYWFDTDKNYFNVVSLSALLMLFYNPFYIYDLGFLLSYFAVLGILLFHSYFRALFSVFPKFFRESFALTFSAQILVFPLVLIYFHKIILFSFIANLFVVPMAGAIIALGFLSLMFGMVHLNFFVLKINLLNSLLVKFMIAISAVFSKIPFLKIDDVNLFLLIGIFFGILLLIFWIYNRRKYIIMGLLIFFVLFSSIGIYYIFNLSGVIIVPSIGHYQNLILLKSKDKAFLVMDAKSYSYHKIEKFLFQNNIHKIDSVYDFSKFDSGIEEKLHNNFEINQYNRLLSQNSDTNIFFTLYGYGVNLHTKIFNLIVLKSLPESLFFQFHYKKIPSVLDTKEKQHFIFFCNQSHLPKKFLSSYYIVPKIDKGTKESRMAIYRNQWKIKKIKW